MLIYTCKLENEKNKLLKSDRRLGRKNEKQKIQRKYRSRKGEECVCGKEKVRRPFEF